MFTTSYVIFAVSNEIERRLPWLIPARAGHLQELSVVDRSFAGNQINLISLHVAEKTSRYLDGIHQDGGRAKLSLNPYCDVLTPIRP
jgi:hypothetical protein